MRSVIDSLIGLPAPVRRRGEQEVMRLSHAIFDAVSQGVVVADHRRIIVAANDAFCAITGYSRDEVVGRDCKFLQGPQTDPRTLVLIRQALAASQPFASEILNYRKDGTSFWNELTISPVRDASGKATHYVGVTRDITERLQAQERLRDSEQRLRLALQGGHLGLWDWHAATGQLVVNDRWLTMLGLDPGGPPPTIDTWNARVLPEDRPLLDQVVADVILNPQGRDFEVEVRARHSDGRTVWIMDRGAVVERAADGRPLRVVGTHMDITARKEAEARTHWLAYFDALTGLPNRRLLLDRLGQSLSRAHRTGHRGALMCIDLDNFKQINDARGHAVGDAVLRAMAERLEGHTRGDDTVARLAGDEFVVLVSSVGPDIDLAARHAMAAAEKLRRVIETPLVVEGLEYSTTCSIGITMFPKQGESCEDLLREADIAMYSAKAAGTRRAAFFEPAMQVEVEQRLVLEQDLKHALAAGQMHLHVQPQVDALGHEVGAELLLRWQHPTRGAVSPAVFIPIAEDTGVIIALGEFVLREACLALRRMSLEGHRTPLSVNVSPRQFRQDDFVERVTAIVEETEACAGDLIFEVTESLLIDDWRDVVARMNDLAALGIRFSIDDFGTGYSSLGYLKKLPLYELKIDKSFVQDTPHDSSDAAIVKSIIAVARHLRLRVVAEGVETQAQADFLHANHCDCLQGYLFARPMPLLQWLQRRAAGPGPWRLSA